MKVELIEKSKFQTNRWSGGSTKELFIFPQDTEYQQRDFIFRISTATVEVDATDFTSLPGISRKLMVLDGAIEISHEGHYKKLLNRFDSDFFEGDWKTSSKGKCTDFNVMTKGSVESNLSYLKVSKNEIVEYPIPVPIDWIFMYLYSGVVSLNVNGIVTHIHAGDLLVIQKVDCPMLAISGIENSEVICTKIKF